MKIRIDPDAKAPVHRQIADQLRFAIQTGKLKPGEKLPSLRSLASNLGLAVNTVAKAYKSLETAGSVQAGQRSAYKVCGKPTASNRSRKGEDSVRYAARGVSATKSEVHGAIAGIDKGVFPGSFCKITEDFLTGDPDLCNLIHADGSGTSVHESVLSPEKAFFSRSTNDLTLDSGTELKTSRPSSIDLVS